MARSNATETPEQAAAEPARPAVPDDTVRRLGIEPEAPEEARIQRPRFLDINEPAKETATPTTAGTSTIVGPSFLGLSDAPLIAAESLPPEIDETERKSHWRGWVAVAILLIFAALGVVQWRAQTGNSPLQTIKAKWYSLRHGNSQQASNQPAPTDQLAADTIPQTQTPTKQPNPQATTPTNSPTQTATNSNTTSAPNPGTSQQSAHATATPSPTQAAPPPAAPAKRSAELKPQSPPTIDNSQAAAPAQKSAGKTVTQASAASPDNATPMPKPKRSSDDSADQRPKGVPGADEMAKAKNASDAAASAAWLWKATAKGNPEAPVQLADMYIKGTGVPRSCEQAVVLLKTAAEKENALARNRLASMYATGNCVQRNRVEAYHWLSAALSANPQSQWAQQNRDILWNQMTPDEQAAAQKYR